MKKLLFIIQSVLVYVSYFFFFAAGVIYSIEYSQLNDPVDIRFIIQGCVAACVFFFGSVALHFIRLNKYGPVSLKPFLSGIHFMIAMLLPLGWLVWIARGYMIIREPRCAPTAYSPSDYAHLSYHLLAAAVLLLIQFVYWIVYYLTERFHVSRGLSRGRFS